jgi:hypothetical protein
MKLELMNNNFKKKIYEKQEFIYLLLIFINKLKQSFITSKKKSLLINFKYMKTQLNENYNLYISFYFVICKC